MKKIIQANCESPKTPGGISKSLLTPCRRLGLSKNWRNKGSSSFVSPLASKSSSPSDIGSRKRKECDTKDTADEGRWETPSNTTTNIQVLSSHNVTPCRNVGLPRKKSKTLIKPLNECTENMNSEVSTEKVIEENHNDINKNTVTKNIHAKMSYIEEQDVSKPVKINSLKQTLAKNINEENCIIQSKENILSHKDTDTKPVEVTKERSPRELTKECVVVIQKKIFKVNDKDISNINAPILNFTDTDSNTRTKKAIHDSSVSQVLFESDSDDVPLINLNKNSDLDNSVRILDNKVKVDDLSDFEEKPVICTVKKLEDKKTSTGDLCKSKSKKTKKILSTKPIQVNLNSILPSSQSSNSVDEDDDDDFDMTKKKTILIRKSYNKVTKPIKAKSTGSISQQAIDELKARIEMKKKMLLAKSMTKDTDELRNLIKKWQKGCQDALFELMELLKKSMPEKQNMSYSEVLEMLRIPSELVSYDSENDCFISPDDASIMLTKFNN